MKNSISNFDEHETLILTKYLNNTTNNSDTVYYDHLDEEEIKPDLLNGSSYIS